MSIVLATLFILMLLTPCLLAFRGRSKDGMGEQETVKPQMAAPIEASQTTTPGMEFDFPRAGVVKTKQKQAIIQPQIAAEIAATVKAQTAIETQSQEPQTSESQTLGTQALGIQTAEAPRTATLQQRVEEAEEEARVAGSIATRARDLARKAHGRAVACEQN